MPTINTFIHFNGNAEEAFNFYRSVFGGEFSSLMRFKDLPENSFPAEEENKIMKIALPIGTQSVLMGSDVPNMLGNVNEHENRSKIMIRAKSKEEADHLFHGLSNGGTIEMPISEGSPWDSYFGMLRDRYGIEWMIEYKVGQ